MSDVPVWQPGFERVLALARRGGLVAVVGVSAVVAVVVAESGWTEAARFVHATRFAENKQSQQKRRMCRTSIRSS